MVFRGFLGFVVTFIGCKIDYCQKMLISECPDPLKNWWSSSVDHIGFDLQGQSRYGQLVKMVMCIFQDAVKYWTAESPVAAAVGTGALQGPHDLAGGWCRDWLNCLRLFGIWSRDLHLCSRWIWIQAMLSRQNLSAKPVVSNPPSKGSRVYFSLLNARAVATWGNWCTSYHLQQTTSKLSFRCQKFRPENIYCEQCQWNHSSGIV